ncbi:NAD-dependent epimerase/dehydratase family protein [Glycomyces sp. L485]|uniref:NAD-dependent epimerase/dehydratase family protein n=1 Tax=Glycomyces sp. L485 TaxID=2909235 RepID=UPI001F4B2EAD|nr:NAD-dependent epimerase/dehydratase family protein [Glycomyces sp. L485]MCH7232915.1 NAD-dependent epimerase/dehydratase family protein [Glycomyces sp. L485]
MTQRRSTLVLGGTVYLSKEIAKQAADRGHDVTVAARGESGEPPGDVEFLRVDRSSAEGVEPLRGRSFDGIVDVARVPGQVGRVLDALADGAGHWTFVSSISVYADHSRTGSEVLEPTDPDSDDSALELYGSSKVACEELVRARLGDKAFIPRPGLIVGAGDNVDRLGYWPLRIAEGGEVLAPGRPERLVQWVDVENLASWILDAAERGVTGTYDAIAEPSPMESLLHQITDALIDQEVLEERPDFVWVPQEFLTEHGVNPWTGPDSLGLWVPEPDYDGMLSRPSAPAVAAGLRPSPLAETVQRWWSANAETPKLVAGMSREKEGAVLGAWHDLERRFTVPGLEKTDGPA